MTITAVRSDSENHRYEIKTNTNATIGVMGCFDSEDKHTQAHVKNVFGSEEYKPDLIIMLGDLAYHALSDDGVKSAKDLAKLVALMSALENVPVFMAYGNHEGRIHGGRRKYWGGMERTLIGTSKLSHGLERRHFNAGYHDRLALEGFGRQPQISQADERSKRGGYIRRNDGQWMFLDEPFNPLFQVGNSRLNQFNMGKDGYYVISLALEDADRAYCELIVLDTNTLPYDDVQQQWLIDTINSSSADQILLMGHHGIMTPVFDKRFVALKDAKLYADANAELMAAKEADVREPTQDQLQTLADRQREAREKVQARYQQLMAVTNPDHVSVLNYVFHKEVMPKLGRDKAAKIKGHYCAHAHHLEAVSTPSGNQLVIGGGMGGKLNKVLTDYGQDAGHLLYGNKATGVLTMTVGQSIKGQFVAGLPHVSVGDRLFVERAQFEIEPNCRMTVTYVENNTEYKSSINRVPNQGWFVSRTEQPVGKEVRLISTRGHLDEPRVDIVPQGGQQLARALPGPMNSDSELLRALKLFGGQLDQLARVSNIVSLTDENRTEMLLPVSQSRLARLFCARPTYSHQRMHELSCVLGQARRVHQSIRRQYAKKGPWQKPLILLSNELASIMECVATAVEENGLDAVSLPASDADNLLKRLSALQKEHGQSHRTWRVYGVPILTFSGIVIMASLLIFLGDVIFGGDVNLQTGLGDAGVLLAAMFIAQIVARAQSRRADEGLAVEVTKLITQLEGLVNSVKTAPEEMYEALGAMEEGRSRCCFSMC